jgi:hypothetical protein
MSMPGQAFSGIHWAGAPVVVRQNSIGITYCRHAPPSFEFAASSIFESLTPRGNVKNRSLGGPVDLMHAGGAHPWAGH